MRSITSILLGLMLVLGLALPASAAVVVTVNGVQITDVQVSQRTKLMALEGGGNSKAATDQLIDEAVVMSEAGRLGIDITDGQVSEAFLGVARNLKMSPDKLTQVLGQAGVNLDTLRARLRSSLAWQAVIQASVQSQVQISELELEQQAASQLSAQDGFDYVLKEIIFVSNNAGQANQYRSQFPGCDGAVQLSLSFTDAAVIDIGRRHATQLPEALATELAGLNVGGITKPRASDRGLSMYAVCSKDAAQDLTFVTNDLRQEAGNKAVEERAKAYLGELRSKARITYG